MTKNKFKFKPSLSFFLFILFFAISVALSYKIKVQSNDNSVVSVLDLKTRILSYHMDLLNQTLKDNYYMSGLKIIDNNIDFNIELLDDGSNVPVLHLKQDACSTCYIETIKNILKTMDGRMPYYVISHKTNRRFVKGMIYSDIITKNAKILWIDKDLYKDGLFQSTADLLVLNPDMSIRFFLPLDFLKEEYFFEKYMLFLEENLTKK